MPIPVLLVAFNRPKLTRDVLSQIERHSRRDVFVSLDGPPPTDSPRLSAWYETARIIESWKAQTKHSLRVRFLDSNMGCNKHTLNSLAWVTRDNDCRNAILIEDDVEFQNQYITFLDTLNLEKVHSRFLSICATNSNWNQDLSFKPKLQKVSWFSSSILSQTWGMTFSSRSVDRLEEFIATFNESCKIEVMIKRWALDKTQGNTLLRLRFNEYWQGKYRRIMTTWNESDVNYDRNLEVGWDAVYQLAAANFNEEFLIPDWNIARTSLEANDGAWHAWLPPYPPWKSLDEPISTCIDLEGVEGFKQELAGLRFSHRRFPLMSLLRLIKSGH